MYADIPFLVTLPCCWLLDLVSTPWWPASITEAGLSQKHVSMKCVHFQTFPVFNIFRWSSTIFSKRLLSCFGICWTQVNYMISFSPTDMNHQDPLRVSAVRWSPKKLPDISPWSCLGYIWCWPTSSWSTSWLPSSATPWTPSGRRGWGARTPPVEIFSSCRFKSWSSRGLSAGCPTCSTTRPTCPAPWTCWKVSSLPAEENHSNSKDQRPSKLCPKSLNSSDRFMFQILWIGQRSYHEVRPEDWGPELREPGRNPGGLGERQGGDHREN